MDPVFVIILLTLTAVLFQWVRTRRKLNLILKGVNNLSVQSDAAKAAFSAFQAQFATFSADTTQALADIAAKPTTDPADAQTLTDIAAGLTTTTASLADLDAKIKAADPGAPPAV